MSDEAPASLRQADPNIYKTATRAAQLQSVKPIVAYWCEYWVLKQILSKSLHTSSPDILEYSTTLMDKLEQTKTEHAHEDAILDDIAGQAYIEQFAQETLDRAQRVVRAGKVTATTANTFDAAASFFGLVNIWGPPDSENLQKIKYAKWNATRILKALKEGKDPNETNPQLEELPALQPDEHELAAEEELGAAAGPTTTAAAPNPRHVTIEDEPDRDDAPTAKPFSPTRSDSPPISIPSVPTYEPATTAPSAPFAPSSAGGAGADLPDDTAPPPAASPRPFEYASAPAPKPAPKPVPAPAPAPVPVPVRERPPPSTVDDAAMMDAQKHAKWAISALNFEDVQTAIRELRKALESLGA